MVTIMLMSWSWISNFVRIGCYIITLHDAVDFWLEAAKITKYCRLQRLCDILFVIFTLSWAGTRLYVYPFYVVRSVLFECRQVTGSFYSWYGFVVFLLTLQAMHIMWFAMILRVLYTAIATGEVKKDSRSDSEGDSTDTDCELDSDDEGSECCKNLLIQRGQGDGHDLSKGEVNANVIVRNGKLPHEGIAGTTRG